MKWALKKPYLWPSLLSIALSGQACSRPTLVGGALPSTTDATTTAAPTQNPGITFGYTDNGAAYLQGFPITLNPPTASPTLGLTTFQVTPALPSGLNLDPATGEISGVPSAMAVSTSYVVEATTNSGLHASSTISFSIISSVPDPAQCEIMISPTNIAMGGTAQLTLTLKNVDGIRIADNSAAPKLTSLVLSTGTSTATIGAFQTGSNPGMYSATVTGVNPGTTNKVQVSYSGTALTQQPGFLVLPGPPGKVLVSSGDAQVAAAGAALASQLVAKVTDINGNFVAGATVYWSVISGGGSFSATSSVTDSNGFARITWTLGTTVGPQTARASVAGVPLPANFTATATPGALKKFIFTNVPSASDAGVSFGFTVSPADTFGNILTDYTGPVHFTSTDPFSPALPADTNFTLTDAGSKLFNAALKTVGAQKITASAGLAVGTSTAVVIRPGGAAQLLIITGPVSRVAGQLFPSLVIRAVDAFGNTATTFISSITIAIDTNPGSGTLSGTKTISATAGSASFAGLSIDKVGIGYKLVVTATGILPATSDAFDISPGTASALVVISGNAQSAPDTTALPLPFTVQAQDAYGNAVPGAHISWFVSSGGGSTTPVSTTTDSSGFASSTLTLGSSLGSQSVQATLQGTSISKTFNATAIPGPPASIAITAGNNQSGIAGTAMATPLGVTVKDAGGNLLPSIQIDWAYTTAAGGLTPVTSQTDITGTATTLLTLSTTAGTNTITATVHGTSILATFTAKGAPSTLSMVFGSGGTKQPSTKCLAVSITAMDPAGNAANVYVSTNVTLSSTGSGAFYSDSGCTVVTTATVIPVGSSSSTVYYLDLKAETGVATSATDTTGPLTASNVSLTIGPGKLVWSGASAMQLGICKPIVLRSQDGLKNITGVLTATTFNLSTSGSGSFYSNSSCTTAITTLSWAAGVGSGTIYYKDSTFGRSTLTASDPAAVLSPAKLVASIFSVYQWGIAGTGTAFNQAVTTDSSGNVYTVGYTKGNLVTGYGNGVAGNNGELFVAKFDSTGAKQWLVQKGVTGRITYGKGVAIDASGNVYAAGYTNGNLTVGSGGAGGAWDLFIIKFDGNGVQQWIKTISKAANTVKADGVNILSIDSSGNLYVTGDTTTNLAAGTGSSTGSSDAFVAKLDSSGTTQWIRQMGVTGKASFGYGTSVDAAGNVYMVGNTYGNLVTGTGPSTTVNDFFAAKYNSAGTLQWVYQPTAGAGVSNVSSTSFAVVADASGNVYVAGHASVNLNTGAAYVGFGAFLQKLSSTGTSLWVKQLQTANPGFGVYGYGVKISSTGAIALSGYTAGTVGGTLTGAADFYLMRYDSAGTFLGGSQKGMSGATAVGNAMAIDSSDNFIIAGYTSNMSVAVSGNYTRGASDALVMKFDSSGAYQWASEVGSGIGAETPGSATSDSSGNTFIAGYSGANLETGLAPMGVRDGFIIKVNSSGAASWIRSFGVPNRTTLFRSIAVDSSGNSYVTGQSNGDVVNGTGATANGMYESFIIKYDSAGVLKWVKQTSSGAGLASYGYGVAVDSGGNSFVTGYTTGNLVGTAGYPKGTNDLFLMKFDSAGAPLWTKQVGWAAHLYNPSSVVIDSGGNVILGGSTNHNFSNNALVPYRTAFVMKYDTTGTQLWQKQSSTNAYAFGGLFGNAVSVDPTDNVFITGLTYTNLSIGSGLHNGLGYADSHVIKYNSAGTQQWIRSEGITISGTAYNTYGTGVAASTTGKSYLIGQTMADLVGGQSASAYDTFFVGYDTDGTKNWMAQFNQVNNYGTAVTVDSAGNACFVGYTSNNLVTAVTSASTGPSDVFMAKFPP